MLVRAIKPGFYGGDLKDVGDTFDVPDGTKSKWFVKVVDSAEPAAGNNQAAQGNRRGGGSRPRTETAEPAAGTSSP